MLRKKGNAMKICILLVTVLVASMFTGCNGNGEPAASEANGDYVAIINGEVITQQDYQEQVAALKETIAMQYEINPEEDPELLANIENQALQSLVHEMLVIQEGKNRGIEVPESEVEESINNIKTGFDSEEAFSKALEDNNLSIDKLKEQIRRDLLINEVIEQVYIDAGIDAETGAVEGEEQDRVVNDFLAGLVEDADIEYNR